MDLLKFINEDLKGYDVSIYAPSEEIEIFLCEHRVTIVGDRIGEVLRQNDYVILSRINVRNNAIWILEELFDDFGETVYNESDVAIIFEDVMEIIDLDNVIVDKIVVVDNEEDEQELYFEDLVEDFLNELEDEDVCAYYRLKEVLSTPLKELIRDVYETARKDLLLEIFEEIE